MGTLKKAELKKRDKALAAINDTTGAFTGDGVVTLEEASGVPLEFEVDSDCILRYLTTDDITNLIPEEKRDRKRDPDARALIHKFFDGRRVVAVSQTFKLSRVKWESGYYYYIVECGLVETDLNPMKDFKVVRLGVSGESIGCPKRVADDGTFVLSDEGIGEVNYNRLNYPLRGTLTE